jgi:Mrp family chromosome partitioning ATPase
MDKVEHIRRPILAQAVEDELLTETPVASAAPPRLGSLVSFERSPILRPTPKPQSRLVGLNVQDPVTAEFGLLASRLNKFKAQNRIKRVLVAGCDVGSGCSLIAANLAMVLAQNPAHRVLLVEANLQRPGLCDRFGLQTHKGLSEYLQAGEQVENLVRHLDPGRVWFLPAGTPPRTEELRGQLLQSPRLTSLLHEEVDWFDWVVVDAPSLRTWFAARAVAQLCDGIMVVVRRGHTEKKLLRRALDLLEGLPLLGFAWND